jgi:excisionase family DNA binding protein
MTDNQEALVSGGLLTVPEALALLRIGRSKLYDLMSDEKMVLPYTKIGRCRRLPRRAVLELAAGGLKGKEPQT